jgi:hypothetical protein
VKPKRSHVGAELDDGEDSDDEDDDVEGADASMDLSPDPALKNSLGKEGSDAIWWATTSLVVSHSSSVNRIATVFSNARFRTRRVPLSAI